MPCPDWLTIQDPSLELSIGWAIKIRVSKEERGEWMLDRPPTVPPYPCPLSWRCCFVLSLVANGSVPSLPPHLHSWRLESQHKYHTSFFFFLTNPDKITGNEINMKLSEDVRLQLGLEVYQRFRRAAFLFNSTDYKTKWLERGEVKNYSAVHKTRLGKKIFTFSHKSGQHIYCKNNLIFLNSCIRFSQFCEEHFMVIYAVLPRYNPCWACLEENLHF